MSQKRVVVLQSNYIPWKGYFDLIRSADLLVFYDDVQFTKNDWRNRNLIKTPQGLCWLTVPVGQNINRRIDEVLISDKSWQRKHLRSLVNNYSRTQHFDEVEPFLNELYIENSWDRLSELNQWTILQICYLLRLENFDVAYSKNFSLVGTGEERLLNLLELTGATTYVTGPNGLNYLNPEEFTRRSIELSIIDYGKYESYSQPHPPFAHNVSILDTLMCCGPRGTREMLNGTTLKAQTD